MFTKAPSAKLDPVDLRSSNLHMFLGVVVVTLLLSVSRNSLTQISNRHHERKIHCLEHFCHEKPADGKSQKESNYTGSLKDLSVV